jgi:SAM-dependent methyltransferase
MNTKTMDREEQKTKYCARCNRRTATPYIRKHISDLPQKGHVLDLGCGNGRNSEYFKQKGYTVTSVDMVPTYQGAHKIILGDDPLPGGTYDIILANYVLMFLPKEKRESVLREIMRHSKISTYVVIELYHAKRAFPCTIEEIIELFFLSSNEWEILHKVKDRCILKKKETIKNV